MNYFIYTSRHFTPHGRYELNKLTSLPMCGFIAQLVEHRTGIAEVTGSNPVEALIFFRLLLSNCLHWKINCDDHSLLNVCLCSEVTTDLGLCSLPMRQSRCPVFLSVFSFHPQCCFPFHFSSALICSLWSLRIKVYFLFLLFRP